MNNNYASIDEPLLSDSVSETQLFWDYKRDIALFITHDVETARRFKQGLSGMNPGTAQLKTGAETTYLVQTARKAANEALQRLEWAEAAMSCQRSVAPGYQSSLAHQPSGDGGRGRTTGGADGAVQHKRVSRVLKSLGYTELRPVGTEEWQPLGEVDGQYGTTDTTHLLLEEPGRPYAALEDAASGEALAYARKPTAGERDSSDGDGES